VGVIVVALVFSALFALIRGDSVKVVYDDPTNVQGQRDKVMAVGRTFVTVFSEYGPDDLDEQNKLTDYVDRVEGLMTSKFATTFEQGVTFAEQTVVQQQVTREAQVYAVGVTRIDEDSARVLVAGADRVSIPDPEKPTQLLPYAEQPFRYEVDLVLTQGEWLVDAFGPVGSIDAPDPEELPSSPTEAPTTVAPSDDQGGGDGQ
jgi:hypothetical protein